MSFIKGVWRLLGAETDEQEQAGIIEHPAAAKPKQFDASSAEVISMPPPLEATLHVLRPEPGTSKKSKYTLKRYAEYLRAKQAIILDVNMVAKVDKVEATRIVDVLTGVIAGIDGSIWEVGKNIFVFAPKNYKLKGDPLKKVEVT